MITEPGKIKGAQFQIVRVGEGIPIVASNEADEAKADCEARNARAKEFGIDSRYEVVKNA